MGQRSLYGLLGVAPSASADDVRAAYRRAARRTHPDTGGSEREFRQVNAAYRVLGEPDRRRRYDERLAADRAGTRSAGPGAARPGAWPGTPPSAGRAAGPAGSPGRPTNPAAAGSPAAARPASSATSPIPQPDARARRHYFVAMGICLTLFVLAGAVVRLFSVPAAIGMMVVAMVIPPGAAIAVNRPPRGR